MTFTAMIICPSLVFVGFWGFFLLPPQVAESMTSNVQKPHFNCPIIHFPITTLSLTSNITFLSNNSGAKEAIIFPLPNLPLIVSHSHSTGSLPRLKQLLVGCNGLPVLYVVVFNLRPRRQFAQTELIYQPYCWSTCLAPGEQQKVGPTFLHYNKTRQGKFPRLSLKKNVS